MPEPGAIRIDIHAGLEQIAGDDASCCLARHRRYVHASNAVMNGASLRVAGRLPGHWWASTANRYVHLDDGTLGEAAERVALAVQRKLRGRRPPSGVAVAGPV